jgi:GNAT superfamily N-acetyltransferase
MGIQPFQPDDCQEILSIHQKIYQNLQLENFLWQPSQQIESLEKDCFKVVWKNGQVKGFAAVYQLDETHFRLNLLVDQSSTGSGLGGKLLQAVEREAKSQGCRSLQVRVLEGITGGLEFALAHQFTEVHRMRGMILAAQDFSYENWRELGDKLAAENFVVTTLENEFKRERQPLEKLIELYPKAVKGWPLIDPTVSHNIDPEHIKELFSNVVTGHISIIKEGAKYLGYTSADRANLIGTAIDADFRGRGLATWLKACNLKLLIDEGETYFESASANPSMIYVNQKLGYQLNGLTEIRLVKYL